MSITNSDAHFFMLIITKHFIFFHILGRDQRRRTGRTGYGGGYHQLPAIHYRSVSQREKEDRGSCNASQGERQEDRDHRRIREQSKRYRCQDPAWRNGLCDRCIGIR